MSVGLIGKKCGMTRVYTAEGVAEPVTVIAVQANYITQVKTIETDGYNAIQITCGKAKLNRVSKPLAGHFAKANVDAGDGLWEFRVDNDLINNYQIGEQLPLAMFGQGQFVDVVSVSKGKGFAGVIKRHNFATQDATHGNSVSHRAPGSIGQRQTPGRVFKGKRMAGHMGDRRCTILNQQLVRVDEERGLLLIRGAVPGAVGAKVIVKHAVKKPVQNEGK
jgi:large subunit ribosomal protein L3